MGDVDINTLTMEQYLALTRGNQSPGVVKPKIGNNVNFEIKSQFMRELKEDTFSGNKNDDAHEYVENFWTLSVSSASHEFLMTYFPPSKTAKQLKEIHNFKQEGDETLYQAGERGLSLASSDSSDGIAAITSKLNSLGRDMKKLKENVHAIQEGCVLCGGTHLNKECPLNEEVKGVEEVKYGEFGRSFPNNVGNEARFDGKALGEHIYEHKEPKHRTKELGNVNEQLTKDFQAKADKEAPTTSTPIGHYKAIFADNDAQSVGTCSNDTNKLHGVSFISNCDVQVTKKKNEGSLAVLSCQLPPKELKPGSFTLPCTIGSLNMYALEDLVEMDDIGKKAPRRIAENVLVKNDKFVFPCDFVVIDMNRGRSILKPKTIQEEESFDPLEIAEDLFSYDSPLCLKFEKYNHLYDTDECNEDTFVCFDDVQEPLIGRKGKTKMAEPGMVTWKLHSCKPIRVKNGDLSRFWPTCDPNLKDWNKGDSIYGRDEHGVLEKWYCFVIMRDGTSSVKIWNFMIIFK
ncbi:hypothetical protein Tco_0710105 [Tanacetum coccineum]